MICIIVLLVRDVSMSRLEHWKGDLQKQFPRLVILNITGNSNLVIPGHFIKHNTLKQMIGVYLGKNCSSCLLTKEFSQTKIVTNQEGFVFSKDCLEVEYTFKQDYRKFSAHSFVPVCVTENEQCLKEVGASTQRNHCLILRKLMSYILLPMGSLSFVCNLIVTIVIVIAGRLKRRPSLILVANICACDILLSGNCVLVATLQNVSARLQKDGNTICQFLTFISVTTVLSTSLASLVITIERYLAIVFSMNPEIRMKRKAVHFSLIVGWVLAVGGGAWLASVESVLENSTQIQACVVTVFRDKISPASGWYILVILALSYFPIIPLYIHIYLVAKASRQRVGLKRDLSLAKRIFLVVATNLVLLNIPVLASFLGFLIGFYRGIIHSHEVPLKAPEIISASAYIFYVINSLANPFLYGFGNRSFMNAAKGLWTTCCFKKNGSRHHKHKVPKRVQNTQL